MLKLIYEGNQRFDYQDEDGNIVKVHEDGTILEAIFKGVTYESWGEAIHVSYWKKVGKGGKISKAFEEWISKVESDLNKKGNGSYDSKK